MAMTREEREIMKAEIKSEMQEELEQQAVNALTKAGVEPTFDLASRQAWSEGEIPQTGTVVERYITFIKGVSEYTMPSTPELEGASLLNFKVVNPNKDNTFSPYFIEIEKDGKVVIKLREPVQSNLNCMVSFRK